MSPPEDAAAPGLATERSGQTGDQAGGETSSNTTADKSGLYIEDAPASLISEVASKKWLHLQADKLVRQRQGETGKRLDYGSLRDILARPPAEPYRIDRLIPWEANTLLVAQRKTGKTTMALNMARCLYTGEQFLETFPTQKITGNVALLNFEVSAAQIGRWADDVDVPERFLIFNARGARNPLADAADRAWLAKSLRNYDVESVIVDPFRAGVHRNFAERFGRGVRLAGCSGANPTGRGGRERHHPDRARRMERERSRGSSALEDWADSIITLTRNEDGQTFFRAMGRDVDVDEDLMDYDPDDRWLTLTGSGSRKDVAGSDKAVTLADQIVSLVRSKPGMNGVAITTALRAKRIPFQKGDQYKALNRLFADGVLTWHASAGAGKSWSVTSGK